MHFGAESLRLFLYFLLLFRDAPWKCKPRFTFSSSKQTWYYLELGIFWYMYTLEKEKGKSHCKRKGLIFSVEWQSNPSHPLPHSHFSQLFFRILPPNGEGGAVCSFLRVYSKMVHGHPSPSIFPALFLPLPNPSLSPNPTPPVSPAPSQDILFSSEE